MSEIDLSINKKKIEDHSLNLATENTLNFDQEKCEKVGERKIDENNKQDKSTSNSTNKNSDNLITKMPLEKKVNNSQSIPKNKADGKKNKNMASSSFDSPENEKK